MPGSDCSILKALLEAEGHFVSGNLLAQNLGISRVGVWARLEKLREEGFEIEAVRHRGYRLVREPRKLNECLLEAYLAQMEAPPHLVFFSEVDSTNSEAERQLANGVPAPFVVLAAHQSRGRGRLGRTWHSPNEGNIYASFAFRPEVPHGQMQPITIWLGLLICDLIARRFNLPVMLKWPNDLLIEGRKLAGMLTEARIDADRTRDLVFGVGLNVLSPVDKWPAELAAISTSLVRHYPGDIRVNQLAVLLTKTCLEGYQAFLRGEHQGRLGELWATYDALRGREVQVSHDGQSVRGSADGLAADGTLIVALRDGRRIHVRSGEALPL